MAHSPGDDRRPALGDRALFPDLEAKAYLSHAAIAPASIGVQAAVARMLGVQARLGQGIFPEAEELRERVRAKLARLLGTGAENVALASGTSHALSHLALSFPWRSGDGLVLLQGEFPANVTPWRAAARLYGLEVHWLSLEGAEQDPDRLLGALEDRLERGARLVAVSAVQFQTGLCMPLAEMASLCHRYGAEIAVDAIQAAGVVPLETDAWGLDYVAGGAHKWLMGIEGAGYLVVRSERVRALQPVTAGWLSHERPIEFLLGGGELLDYERPLVDTPRVFEAGSGSVL
ncbi:MAG TPA: aminotransferase class V-fold PLP-dependent enzyme, partial [Polyangiaceae bacterium]